MKKIFAAAAIALFMMTSCSDDDSSSNNNNNTDAVLLKKTVETYEDGSTLTTTYHYNGTKLSGITLSDGSEIDFTYTGNNVTKIEYLEGNVLVQRNALTYDGQDRLATLIEYVFEDGGNWADKSVFTHNANGTVSVERFHGDHTSQTDPSEGSVITIANGNITKNVSSVLTTTYGFDSKNNPEKNITGVDALNLSWQEGGLNNITAYSDDWGANYTKTYTYNTDNYPVTSSEDYDGHITTTQYFYE